MSETPATALLRAQGIPFTPHAYAYEAHGGTRVSSQKLGVDEHRVIKTLVFEDDAKRPFLVLMHGDRSVQTQALARQLSAKAVRPCAPEVAQRHTGYLVGGTSPFGTKKKLPVYLERTVTALPSLFINGGRRGFLVELAPADLLRVLEPTLVDCAAP